MLPPEYRDRILEDSGEGRVVLTILDDCVVGFTAAEWSTVIEEIAKIKNPSKKLRNFKRKFISGSEELALDKQGRVMVPAHLREYGSLDREIVLAGMGAYFEIWNRDEFKQMLAQQDLEDVSEELSECDVNLPI
jgi:MraZ protein